MRYEGITHIETEGSTAERTVKIEEPYWFVLDLMDLITECLRMNSVSITDNTCNFSIDDAAVVSMLRTLTEIYFYLKYGKKRFEDRDLYMTYRRLTDDPMGMLETVRTLLEERRSFHFLYGLFVTKRERLNEEEGRREEEGEGRGEGGADGGTGREVTVLKYRCLKIDVIFNRDKTARISAVMVKDYCGTGGGRIIRSRCRED